MQTKNKLRTDLISGSLFDAGNMAVTSAPYGSWVSPITSDVVVKESISLMEVKVDPFQEGRNSKSFQKDQFMLSFPKGAKQTRREMC